MQGEAVIGVSCFNIPRSASRNKRPVTAGHGYASRIQTIHAMEFYNGPQFYPFLPVATLVLGGCDAQTAGTEDLNVSGNWAGTLNLTVGGQQESHMLAMTLTQTGTNVSGIMHEGGNAEPMSSQHFRRQARSHAAGSSEGGGRLPSGSLDRPSRAGE
ncbi:MAG: hypothetical protein ACT443_10550 [Gemmatimonadota bacterium]